MAVEVQASDSHRGFRLVLARLGTRDEEALLELPQLVGQSQSGCDRVASRPRRLLGGRVVEHSVGHSPKFALPQLFGPLSVQLVESLSPDLELLCVQQRSSGPQVLVLDLESAVLADALDGLHRAPKVVFEQLLNLLLSPLGLLLRRAPGNRDESDELLGDWQVGVDGLRPGALPSRASS